MQSQSTSERKHLLTELAEQQRSYDGLTERIQAIDTDLEREDDSLERLNLEDRKKELIDKREDVVANMKKTEEKLNQIAESESSSITTALPVQPTPTEAIWDPRRIRFSLGAFALALILSIVAAYALTLLWVIPQRLPVLSDPLIKAALTAQPPRAKLVAVGLELRFQNEQYCVKTEETVRMRIEPKLGDSGDKYFWSLPPGVERIETVGWESGFVAPKSAGNSVTVVLCEKDLTTGVCGVTLDYMIFVVKEVC